MKKIALIIALLCIGTAFAQQKRGISKPKQDSEEVRQKKQQAEEDIRKSREEKKARMEAARRDARERVSRDTTKTKSAGR